jgi:hypothetical protein
MLRLRAGIVQSEEQVESDVEGRENRRERRAQATCEMPAETSDLQSPHRSSTSHWLLEMKNIKKRWGPTLLLLLAAFLTACSRRSYYPYSEKDRHGAKAECHTLKFPISGCE